MRERVCREAVRKGRVNLGECWSEFSVSSMRVGGRIFLEPNVELSLWLAIGAD